MGLVDTLRRSFLEGARHGDEGLLLLVWAAAVVKVIAAVLPLGALLRLTRPQWNRLAWVLSWLAAMLTLYGLVNSTARLVVLPGTVRLTAGSVHRTLTWHAYPWFLVWGLLAAAALLLGRHNPSPAAGHHGSPHSGRLGE